MKFAFILDPLDGLKAYKDSSVAMMRVAAKRGHEVWAIQRGALTWRDGRVAARAQKLALGSEDQPWCGIEAEATLPLTAWDAVLAWPLDSIDLALRRAGWDQDPGWLPWLGRRLRWRFGDAS